MFYIVISLISAYLIGSIPTAYLFGRIIKGIDIRNYGSGNVGATNVYRVVGKVPGFMALFLDILKGCLPVIILPVIFNVDNNMITIDTYKLLIGISAIAGHVWPVFLKFKGGKGVATTAGVVLALMPAVFIISFIIWVLVFIIFRYVSLASVIAAIAMPIAVIVLKMPISIAIFAIMLSIVGIYKHKSNISRLIKGEEKKIF